MGLTVCLSHPTLALNRGSGDLVAATRFVSHTVQASSTAVACLYPGSKRLPGRCSEAWVMIMKKQLAYR